jgi:tetratricopeptide (TPR) repeat protein
LRRSGRMDEALEHFTRAWDLDPLNDAYAGGPIVTLLALRRFPEAIGQTELYSARFPNEADSYFMRGRIRSRLEGSAEPLKAALRDYGRMLPPNERNHVEARIAVIEGRYLDAAQSLSKLPDAGDPLGTGMNLACLYYAAGDKERADQIFRRVEARLDELRQAGTNNDLVLDKSTVLALAQSMLGKHEAALATSESACKLYPEAGDATNGPAVSYVRSIVLVRAGRKDEGYAEVARLMRVPFGAPNLVFDDGDYTSLLTKDDPRFDELNFHPPRL